MAGSNGSSTVRFTRQRVENHACPPGKSQAFLWDATTPGLGLRATPGGRRTYVFQDRLHGRSVRTTIGLSDVWDLDKAQEEAKRLAVLVDKGIHPAAEAEERRQAEEAAREQEQRSAATLGEAWEAYVAARSSEWSAGHLANHHAAMAAPGQKRQRSKKLTVAGPLHALRDECLETLTAKRLEEWIDAEKVQRPTKAALSYRMLRSALRWIAERPEYAGLVDPAALLTGDVKRKVPKPQTRDDCLQREHLATWFAAVKKLDNPAAAAYLQALLLVGARPGELALLRWSDIDERNGSITIRDKAEGTRRIPITPYVGALLAGLPRRNEWVFSSAITESGRIGEQNHAHHRALEDAGLAPLTLHGLRRSFATLSEWVEAPVGVVAQIMGHKPSAIAEKHYVRRPLDLLRMWHSKIEAWILKQAGIRQPKPAARRLRAVK